MYQYNCTVDRVIDGDTVDAIVDLGFDITIKKRVRLYGIDAPETRTRDLDEKRRGFLTKARLIQILESNNNRFILNSIKIGKFGRCVGIIYIDEKQKSINTMLIEEGLANQYNK